MTAEICHQEDLVLEPISFADIKCNAGLKNDEDHPLENGDSNGVKYFSVVMGVAGSKRKRESSTSSLVQPKHLQHWRHAIMKARSQSDPWEKFHLEDYPTEKALRHRYNALKKSWVVDEVVVKMETKSFARGSMRECFRIKKLSNFSHNQDWRRDRNNAVAKRYITPVERDIYFAEVKLQLDAKLWAEEYNRHRPPKQIDICMMGVLEFIDRPEKPLYHVENFIEGQYVKYNSNGGFVLDDEAHRQTPQAFSHFTFERSGHELIVVDVQGVGDLYTDPQIHTVLGTEYGDGNLGTRGMALFFHTHVCNSICHNLGLTPFDLAPSEWTELSANQRQSTSIGTVSRGNEDVCQSPTDYQRAHLHEFLRMRTSSSIGSCSSLCESVEEYVVADDDDSENTNESTDVPSFRSRLNSETEGGRSSPLLGHANGYHHQLSNGSDGRPTRRPRFISESGSASITDEADRIAFRELADKRARPSGLQAEVEARKKMRDCADAGVDTRRRTGGSVLGQIHLDLANYHEVQRFAKAEVQGYDKEAALYHLRAAADCDNLEAIITMARVALDLPHDVLPDLNASHLGCGDAERVNIGLDYMHLAASAGDRAAMVYLAKAYDSGKEELLGDRLRSCGERRWVEAIEWYSRAVAMDTSDEEGNYDGTMDDPPYQLIARQAEMFGQGGNGLEQDFARAGELYSEAADLAMAAMKGRLANKFYALAEEMNSMVDE